MDRVEPVIIPMSYWGCVGVSELVPDRPGDSEQMCGDSDSNDEAVSFGCRSDLRDFSSGDRGGVIDVDAGGLKMGVDSLDAIDELGLSGGALVLLENIGHDSGSGSAEASALKSGLETSGIHFATSAVFSEDCGEFSCGGRCSRGDADGGGDGGEGSESEGAHVEVVVVVVLFYY